MPYTHWLFQIIAAVAFWFIFLYVPLFYIAFSKRRCERITSKFDETIIKLKNRIPDKVHIH